MINLNTSFQGSWSDRLDGIARNSLPFQNATVLDVGCNIGIVGYEICKSEPSFYHGIERSLVHQFVAKMIFKGIDSKSKIDRFDIGKLKKREKYLNETYDFVFYLAVHQHIARQIGEQEANKLLKDLFKRANKYFLYRGALANQVEGIGQGMGFTLAEQVESRRNNPLLVFKRIKR